MKKVAVIFVVAFVTLILVSACNTEACPAYSKAETEQPSKVA
jgi:hypothetical protein